MPGWPPNAPRKETGLLPASHIKGTSKAYNARAITTLDSISVQL